MTKLVIDSELRDSLLAYLRSRPLGEVLDGFLALANLSVLPPPQIVAKADMDSDFMVQANPQAEAS